MRIRFYGVQGSGSIFPRFSEREAARRVNDILLLEGVFTDLANRTGADGQLHGAITDILGGPMSRAALEAYRDRINPETEVSYGGWTTCILIETHDGHDIVFDCGSGFRNCAGDLQRKWGDRAERELHIFGTHSHSDHTEGFDQALVCFDPRNTISIYGNAQFLYALDQQLGIFSHRVDESVRGIHTPISFSLMPARFRYCPIRSHPEDDAALLDARVPTTIFEAGRPVTIGTTTITPFELFHPAPCLGFSIESGGKRFVFATDHEILHDEALPGYGASRAAEERLAYFALGADLLYRDGQFLRAEYSGEKGIGDSPPIPRNGWGHSCIEDAWDMAKRCGVGCTLIGHHDPNRKWSERQWIDQSLKQASENSPNRIELAKAEMMVDL